MSLENAPDDVKLAVDLIQILEESKLPSTLVLSALEIVRQDYIRKVDINNATNNSKQKKFKP